MPLLSKNLPLPNWLEIQDFEVLCFNLAVEEFSKIEPIPDYPTRDQGLLEASLSAPKQTFDNKLLYPTLSKQGAILFYSIIKNHPFQNGNKRVAVMALLAFLSLNEKWLIIHPTNLYRMALKVSESKTIEKDKILNGLDRQIRKHIEDSDF